jgi:RES domain-containing protein
MRVYRLYRSRRRSVAFQGEGAQVSGGRWNLPGTPLVYTSATLSLCFLELLVHFDPKQLALAELGLEYCFADIADGAPLLETRLTDLPRNWNSIPWSNSTQELGTRWMQSLKYLAVLVPSVVIASEHNILLNPAHPEFSRIKIGLPAPFRVDPRLFQSRASLTATQAD